MIGVTEQHDTLADAVGGWARRHAPIEGTRRLVDGEPPTGRPASWSALAEQGLLAVHLGEEHGGAGGDAVDLAVVVEQFGRHLVPGPFLPTVAVSTVLAQHGDAPVVKEHLPRIADGSAPAALALHPGLTVAAAEGGGLSVSGTVPLVLAGAEADLLLLGGLDGRGAQTWFLLDAASLAIEPVANLDASRRLARVSADALEVPEDRIVPDLHDGVVGHVVATVVAAEAAGLAGWCLDTASEYAKVREQFGRPIGQFQAIKHTCADMLVRTEHARAAAWDAAAALEDLAQFPLAATVAGAVALDAAVDNAKDCVQVLGGIGFTWEHDAHLYLKRALALRQWLGGTDAYRAAATEMALSGTRRTLDLELPGEQAEPLRAEVRAFLSSLEGLDDRAVRERMADSGYAVPHWPAPHGRGAGAVEQLVIDEEFAAAGVSQPNLLIGGWILPTIIHWGSPEQQERFVRPTIVGDIVWCQMFSEPNAGSDLASLQMRAERVDGGWVLDGQKVWTSMAQSAHWSLCLARTDPQAPKHEGITAFLLDMQDSDGIEVRPLREITGMALFNEVFCNDVFVPDENVLGEVHRGWEVARTTLANERVAMSSGSSMGSSVEGLLDGLRASGRRDDPVVRDRVGRLVAEGQTLSVLALRTTLRQLQGTDPGAASSVRKLSGTTNAMACAELALDLLGPGGATTEGAAAQASHAFLQTRCLSIAGGTTEVQKNVIAERLLGLPRDPEPGE